MASAASSLIIPHLRPQLHHYTNTTKCDPVIKFTQSTGWVPGFWIGGPPRLNTRITSDDITEMYFQCACTVFVAKDPFYVRGHHPMRRSGSKRADLALIGFSAPGNLVKHFVYFVQTFLLLCSNIRQFGQTFRLLCLNINP